MDLTTARRLAAEPRIAFIGDNKGGPFEISADVARALLASPNPDGRSNADVVRPWVNGEDIRGAHATCGSSTSAWTCPEGGRALRGAVRARARHVRPDAPGTAARREPRWWIHVVAASGMRGATAGLSRYIATPRLSKHRIFAWLPARRAARPPTDRLRRATTTTSSACCTRARTSSGLATRGTQLREAILASRYTPTTCFETFPFPDPTPEQRDRVGEAARRLVELRDGWLNPPGLDPADLAKRTLTNLYNPRPTWLANAHADLDAAVFAAYGWPVDLAASEILERLISLNSQRASSP